MPDNRGYYVDVTSATYFNSLFTDFCILSEVFMYKYSKNDWKRINKEFNLFMENNDKYNKLIKIEHSTFLPLHSASRDFNGDTTTCEFVQCLTEAKEIYIAGGANSYGIDIYIKSDINGQIKGYDT